MYLCLKTFFNIKLQICVEICIYALCKRSHLALNFKGPNFMMLNTNVKQAMSSYFNQWIVFVWVMLLDYYSVSPGVFPQYVSSLLQSERLFLFLLLCRLKLKRMAKQIIFQWTPSWKDRWRQFEILWTPTCPLLTNVSEIWSRKQSCTSWSIM